jgi:sugar-phosphatase
MKCEAFIFDMDGLLLDSEPLWRRAQIEVFGAHGLVLDDAACASTTGLRIDEVVAYRLAHPALSGRSIDGDALRDRIVDRVIELVGSEGTLLPGARTAIEKAARTGVPLALASSSDERLIHAALEHFDLASSFAHVVSAEREPFGKPHPGVYLTTASRLCVAPTACVAIEDSLNGVIAAKAARMTCVAVPSLHDREDRRFALADVILESLTSFDATRFG